MRNPLLTLKNSLLVLLISILPLGNISAQLAGLQQQSDLQEPVTFTLKTKKNAPNDYTIIVKAKVEDGWHFYSQKSEGTLPLTYGFDDPVGFEPVGTLEESPKPKQKYDDVLKGLTQYWEHEATLKQRVKLTKVGEVKMLLWFDGQACLEDGMCLPLMPEFNIILIGEEVNSSTPTDEPDADNTEQISTDDNSQDTTDAAAIESGQSPDETQELATEQQEETVATTDNKEEKEEKRGMWMIFLISFGLGMLALITPCVFPMIPMTVSFFMKGNKSKSAGRKQAIFFGLSIISIFTILGLILTLALGSDAMYIISTHWIPNTLFFLIFMAFALSFFGLFEITLPSGLINKSDKNADKGGYIGTFFIAFTTVLVSFSCTGPILGAALIGLTSGAANSMVFLISMLGFAVGFALPFSLLAYFPAVMGKMKSGAWLNTVKIVFGFIEIALGLKFLSMADLSANWGILDRETFLALWIVVFAMLGFYLLGKLRFKGDAKVEEIGVSRLFLGIITLSFVVYMVPGLWGAPLKVLSGYVPPMTTQDFDLPRTIIENAGSGGSAHKEDLGKRKYTEDLHLPTGFDGFFDLEEAKAYAKKVNKPIFVDFTGKTCANCREMENNVWTDPEVKKLLNEKFVMVALYADANFIDLPEEEWVEIEGKRPIKTLGKKNLNYQINRFNMNAQPYYVIMDPNEDVLTKENRAYDKDVSIFVEFLEEGIANHKSGKTY